MADFPSITHKLECNVAMKMKVLCPKCKAKLSFDPEKITCEIVKFKCPACTAELRIRKPCSPMEKSSASSARQPEPKADIHPEDPGAELMGLARKFEIEMGFAADDVPDEPGGVQPAVPAAAGPGKMPGRKKDEGRTAAQPADERVTGSGSRNFQRVKFKKKVLVNRQIMVEALDISTNGLFLHTGRSFEDGAIVEVGIPTAPGNFDLTVQAMVKHNHRGIGMGLQFLKLNENQKMQLSKLIRDLDEEASKELDDRKRILLVGGTDTARNINKSKLVLEGFYVLQATTPEEVFTILNNETPDAMVLEWQEPQFNCKGLLARIKEHPEYDAVIRVVLATLTDSSVQREILAAGAHRCMAKMDTNPAKLAIILKQMIDERNGSNQG